MTDDEQLRYECFTLVLEVAKLSPTSVPTVGELLIQASQVYAWLTRNSEA